MCDRAKIRWRGSGPEAPRPGGEGSGAPPALRLKRLGFEALFALEAQGPAGVVVLGTVKVSENWLSSNTVSIATKPKSAVDCVLACSTRKEHGLTASQSGCTVCQRARPGGGHSLLVCSTQRGPQPVSVLDPEGGTAW